MLRGVGAAPRRVARLVLPLCAAADLSVEPALRVVAVLVRDLEDADEAAVSFAECFFLSRAVFFAEAEVESEDAPEAACAAMRPAGQASETQIKNVR